MIDTWGRGTIKIIEACKQAGLPEPEIIERDGGLLVSLFGKDVGVNVGKNVLETLNLIEENPEYTTEQIAKITGKTVRTIERHIAKLKDINIIIRIGSDKVGYWEVNKGER